MTAKTPHGLALDDYLLSHGPTGRRELVQYVAKFVPVGQAVNTAMNQRRKHREYHNVAAGVPPDRVARGYEKRQVDETFSGSKMVAQQTVNNRLRDRTVFVNDDGLIQHRDWKPE